MKYYCMKPVAKKSGGKAHLNIQNITHKYCPHIPPILSYLDEEEKENEGVLLGGMRMKIKNTIDFEILTINWQFISENITFNPRISQYIEEVKIPLEYCCNCTDDCSSNDCICAVFNRFYNDNIKFTPYSRHTDSDGNKLINHKWKMSYHIFECSEHCRCNKKLCRFSMLSNVNPLLEKNGFEITRINKQSYFDPEIKANMWGLVACKDIEARSFVMQYTGEIITESESTRRGVKYDSIDKISYLFGMCLEEDYELSRSINYYFPHLSQSPALAIKDFPLSLDAKYHGNLAKYINHSCNSNLFCTYIHLENRSQRVACVALFANCHIKKGEELTINYNYELTPDESGRIVCLCGDPKCRKYLR